MTRIVNNHALNCPLISSETSAIPALWLHSATLASHRHSPWLSEGWSRFQIKSSLLTVDIWTERWGSIQQSCPANASSGLRRSPLQSQVVCFTPCALSFPYYEYQNAFFELPPLSALLFLPLPALLPYGLKRGRHIRRPEILLALMCCSVNRHGAKIDTIFYAAPPISVTQLPSWHIKIN